jgi:hypothetical protein
MGKSNMETILNKKTIASKGKTSVGCNNCVS